MKFAPKPENDFDEFIRIYYRECRQRFPKIEAIAGKWMYRDLIPGMSDFDTRFVLNDDMQVDDWCHFASVVGQVHLMLCEKYRCWARNLEHLPGANPTWSELYSETSYYPEYKQWTYYHTERPDKLVEVLDWLENRPWDVKDEYFHLKKFTTFFGRYIRGIDPPVNLGVHENKYPLHSRIMHYFNPPLKSAICLIQKRTISGKFDAFEIAEELFPGFRCWESIQEILHANYEIPQWYEEPCLTQLEDELEHALQEIAAYLLDKVTLIPPEAGIQIQAWKQALKRVPLDPAMVIVDSTRFSRTMKGRLDFYCRAPEHFDSVWLIQNELGRIGKLFFTVPFQTFWKLRTGEMVEDPLTILSQLKGDPLSEREIEATRKFAKLTPGTWEKGQEKQIAASIGEIFDDFYRALTKISLAAQ